MDKEVGPPALLAAAWNSRAHACACANSVTAPEELPGIVAVMSPVVHLEDGFRFSFWMNERREPPHVPVRKAGAWPGADALEVGASTEGRLLHEIDAGLRFVLGV